MKSCAPAIQAQVKQGDGIAVVCRGVLMTYKTDVARIAQELDSREAKRI